MFSQGLSTPRENPVMGYKKQSESRSKSREAFSNYSARGYQTPQNDSRLRDFKFGVEDGISDYCRGAAEEEKENMPFLEAVRFRTNKIQCFQLKSRVLRSCLTLPKMKETLPVVIVMVL